jgi:recombination protein RecA
MDKQIKAFLKTVKSELGDDILVIPELGASIVNDKIEVIPTGSSQIDKLLGIGGLPKGRVVEISGTEAGGKTTLALSVIKQAQQLGMTCAYIDTEQALERNRSIDIGVDFDKMAISQPNDAEQALDLLEMMVVSGLFGVIVIDSVSALVPKAELEGGMSDSTIGLQARLMGKILRKIASPVSKNKIVVIFINQVRQKIGGFTPFPVETTSGGLALRFYASVRIDMRRIGMGKKEPVSEHKVTIKKNKLAIPMVVGKVKIGRNGFL